MSKIEIEIEKIETILSKYDYLAVVEEMAFWLIRIAERNTNPFFEGLQSPYKQLHYVATLALKNKSRGLKKIQNEDWKLISACLQEIEFLYNNSFLSTQDTFINLQNLKKFSVSNPTFLSYFFNGSLAFNEQHIDRIERTFIKYDQQIKTEFGLSVSQFIDFVEIIKKECEIKLNLPIQVMKNNQWKEFTSKMDSLNIPLKDWKLHFNESINLAFDTINHPSSIFYIDFDNLHINCDKKKLKLFLDLFTVNDINKDDTIYYGEILPLELNPFLKVSESKYLIFYQESILNAIFKKLENICSKIIGTKFYQYRDKQIEKKVLEIFELLFNQKKSKIYVNYSIDRISEQDILIVFDSTALIIEVKAATFREPMRNPLKSFEKIKSDFKKNIQEAYNQCLRVENTFEISEIISIFNDKKVLIDQIESRKIQNTYSIIVTLDRFGVIQSDLAYLLQIEEDLPFPWSVNIDDLETFILMLKKQKKPQEKFVKFLSHREFLHGRLYASDEIDVCCWFLRDQNDFIQKCKQKENFIVANPKESGLVDRTYFSKGGLGFKKELNIEKKNSDDVIFLGKPY
jgi:hypothetical protein